MDPFLEGYMAKEGKLQPYKMDNPGGLVGTIGGSALGLGLVDLLSSDPNIMKYLAGMGAGGLAGYLGGSQFMRPVETPAKVPPSFLERAWKGRHKGWAAATAGPRWIYRGGRDFMRGYTDDQLDQAGRLKKMREKLLESAKGKDTDTARGIIDRFSGVDDTKDMLDTIKSTPGPSYWDGVKAIGDDVNEWGAGKRRDWFNWRTMDDVRLRRE